MTPQVSRPEQYLRSFDTGTADPAVTASASGLIVVCCMRTVSVFCVTGQRYLSPTWSIIWLIYPSLMRTIQVGHVQDWLQTFLKSKIYIKISIIRDGFGREVADFHNDLDKDVSSGHEIPGQCFCCDTRRKRQD
jgi:hypothetical protein